MDTGIHNYSGKLEKLTRTINNSEIPDETKKLLLDYDKALLLVENLSIPRRLKLVGTMFILVRKYFIKPLKEVTKDDIKYYLSELENMPYSAWTKQGYKVVIKKFFKWFVYGDKVMEYDEYPEIVKFIKIHIKKKNQPKIQVSDILTEEDAFKMISAAQLPRDRAFISMLYELGARISEIGNLCIKDFTRDEYGYLIDLSGKTGHRTPRIVFSDMYITDWLNKHPLNKDPNAPAWVFTIRGITKKLNYAGLRVLVKRLKAKAGIAKRVYPHLFRHSRVTHLLAKGLINEAQAKVYFGWTPDSKMLAEYAHLVSQDANNAILAMHGIIVKEEKKDERHCPRCKRVNPLDAKFCYYCSSILDEKIGFEQDAEKTQIDAVMNKLLRDPEVQALIMKKLAGT